MPGSHRFCRVGLTSRCGERPHPQHEPSPPAPSCCSPQQQSNVLHHDVQYFYGRRSSQHSRPPHHLIFPVAITRRYPLATILQPANSAMLGNPRHEAGLRTWGPLPLMEKGRKASLVHHSNHTHTCCSVSTDRLHGSGKTPGPKLLGRMYALDRQNRCLVLERPRLWR